jgi:hypothetical protein
MIMANRNLLPAIGLAGGLLLATAAQAVLVDNFNVPADTPEAISSTVGVTVWQNNTQGGDIIGGFRDYSATLTDGSDNVEVSTWTCSSCLTWHTAAVSGSKGVFQLVWNGDAAGDAITNNMNVNLTQNGESLLYFEYAADHDVTNIEFRFEDNSGNSASVNSGGLASTGVSRPENLALIILGLPGAESVNYSSIANITLTMAGVPDLDFSLDNVRTTAVPLPGALGLLCAGVVGLGRLGWRRRRTD